MQPFMYLLVLLNISYKILHNGVLYTSFSHLILLHFSTSSVIYPWVMFTVECYIFIGYIAAELKKYLLCTAVINLYLTVT